MGVKEGTPLSWSSRLASTIRADEGKSEKSGRSVSGGAPHCARFIEEASAHIVLPCREVEGIPNRKL